MAKGNVVFGLYKADEGSYTLGEHRFPALTITPVPPDAAKKADTDGPLVFFEAEEAAIKERDRLRAIIDRRTKPQPAA